MKTRYQAMLIIFATMAFINASEAKSVVSSNAPSAAAHTLKAGSWAISYYKSPNEHSLTSTSTICVNSDNTWHIAGPIVIPGSGGWSLHGNNVTLYGTVGEAIQGAAFTAIGHLVGDGLITGRYVHFDLVQNWPNGDSGSFKAVFQGEVCPL
jgi:hypothetical protein